MTIISPRLLGAALAIAVAVGVATQAAIAAPTKPTARPAVELATKNLGKVIATPGKLGIYYWDREKKAGGKIRCTGACAAQWPPVYVKGPVAKHVRGVMATFGTIRRAGKRQLTVNGLPAYTYHADIPGVVKCDNVDGWHAVRPAAG